MFCCFRGLIKDHLLKETTLGSLFLSLLLGFTCCFPQIPLLLLPTFSPPRNLKDYSSIPIMKPDLSFGVINDRFFLFFYPIQIFRCT